MSRLSYIKLLHLCRFLSLYMTYDIAQQPLKAHYQKAVEVVNYSWYELLSVWELIVFNFAFMYLVSISPYGVKYNMF